MFAFGDERWPGLSKLIEECGEVIQECGKLLGTRGELRHWNRENLKTSLEDEIADLLAAMTFVVQFCGLDMSRIAQRATKKLALFKQWHEGKNDRIDPQSVVPQEKES